ncbi:hypothetical protein [Aeromicrobium duanguangcaii]|uniref:hypothetical protein n=1 Tax=Aeromicrobium duanguangcaii TaxID=2968086 RepID=UPI00201707C4|nr:hypothetical protein [Aeromicrobium duanguangcaii]MCL3836891.1 hypothetical protein [Aeromicrobium duanguangcaii]
MSVKKLVSILAVLTLILLGGCGSDGSAADDGIDSSLSSTDGADDGALPDCSKIWKVGRTLDLDSYEGCDNGDEVVPYIGSGCYPRDGNYIGVSANFEDRLWVVQEGASDQTAKGGTPGEVTDVDPKC